MATTLQLKHHCCITKSRKELGSLARGRTEQWSIQYRPRNAAATKPLLVGMDARIMQNVALLLENVEQQDCGTNGATLSFTRTTTMVTASVLAL